jgi:hypothetical protein
MNEQLKGRQQSVRMALRLLIPYAGMPLVWTGQGVGGPGLGVLRSKSPPEARPPLLLPGSKVMEWLKRTTSIAGIQIPNWVIVLGAIIVIWLIYKY